ncbi:hypothetical protein [Nitrobacter sp. JJSN]|uniref:hypothetical protein n=1 Tax=Nitrobacter sp. JJSN TaxID=3453033 RepID=UPI003F77449F
MRSPFYQALFDTRPSSEANSEYETTAGGYRLPVPLPPADRMRVYRVCIALGAAERCKAATECTTLELSPPTLDDQKPFAVGRLSNTAS